MIFKKLVQIIVELLLVFTMIGLILLSEMLTLKCFAFLSCHKTLLIVMSHLFHPKLRAKLMITTLLQACLRQTIIIIEGAT